MTSQKKIQRNIKDIIPSVESDIYQLSLVIFELILRSLIKGHNINNEEYIEMLSTVTDDSRFFWNRFPICFGEDLWNLVS